MNYIDLAADLRTLAGHYEANAPEDVPPMAAMFRGNAEMYRLAAQAIEELTARLVKQACYFEEIEARDDL